MNKKFFVLFSILILSCLSVTVSAVTIDSSKDYLWAGFEKDPAGWTNEDWESNIFSAPKVSGDFVSQGKKSMEIQFTTKGGNASGMIQLYDLGNLSALAAVSFDIYNSSLIDVEVSLMLKSGANWQYQETKPVKLSPGWNKDIRFEVNGPIFRKESNNEYSDKIAFADNVRRFGLLFRSKAAGSGIIFIDNARIKGGQGIEGLLPAEEPVGLKEVTVDDFEKGRLRFGAASDWSCATGVEKIKMPEGTTVMKAIFNMKEPGQNAVFAMEGGFDLSGVYDAKLDIYNPSDMTTNMAVSLSTGDKWSWQEGPVVRLKKGWNRDVTVSFKNKVWKNEQSKWNANVTPGDINLVKRFCLMFNPPDMGEGYVLIDNIRFAANDLSGLDSILPFDMGPQAYRVWNSFEKGVNWSAATNGSSAVAVAPASDFGGEKNKGMELKFNVQNSVDKAMYAYRSPMDFSDSTGMKFNFYNPFDFGVKIAVAFKTGDEETWTETKQIAIAPGWNKDVVIDFVTASFKSAESNWNFTDTFFKRNDVREVVLQIYPDRKAAGSIYMTDIKTSRRNYFGDVGNIIGVTLKNNSSAVVEPVKYTPFESGLGDFEEALTASSWPVSVAGGYGACFVETSDKYSSKGKKSLKITYKDVSNKTGFYYTNPAGFDISDKLYLTFDIYNPGRQVNYAVAFESLVEDTARGWQETKMMVLKPGWNRNVKINLNSMDWKNAGNNWTNNEKLVHKDAIKNIQFMILYASEGTLYLDNVRWGEKADMRLLDAVVEQDVNIEINPTDNIDGKATLRGTYVHGQNTDLKLASARVTARGLGNELTVSGGEPIKMFDDVFNLVDSASLGTNVMGAMLSGTLYPSVTAYTIAGLTIWNSEEWKAGTTYLAGARIKQYFLGSNYAGLLYLNDRRGYDADADVFNDDYEQSSHITGIDFSAGIAPLSSLNIVLKGELLYSAFETHTPVYVLLGPPFTYASSAIKNDVGRMLKYLQADIQFGSLQVNSTFRIIDPNFSMNYADPDIKTGETGIIVKATYLMDNVWPFSALSLLSSEWAAFVRNTSLMAEYDANSVSARPGETSAYGRQTYTIDLKNDQSLALYNYEIWVKYNNEGTASKVSTLKASAVTKILLGSALTLKLLGRVETSKNTIEEYLRGTGFFEASLKITKDIKLTGSYKLLGFLDEFHSNWYAELESILFGSVSVILSYGEKPFTGYWSDDLNNDTITRFGASVKGYF